MCTQCSRINCIRYKENPTDIEIYSMLLRSSTLLPAHANNPSTNIYKAFAIMTESQDLLHFFNN